MRIIYATAILAVIHPALATWLFTSLPLVGTLTASVLIARHAPHRAHPILAFALGGTVAALITGHKPKAAPVLKHAPAGPQIPVN